MIELLVIDDGSTDRTVEVARECGVHHVVSHDAQPGSGPGVHDRHRGQPARRRRHHRQHRRRQPVRRRRHRQARRPGARRRRPTSWSAPGRSSDIQTFSPVKKALQHVGTHAVRVLSGTEVRDATSGFRAFSREAALRLQVHGQYTYTLETIIQAGAEGLKLKAVPIGVNPQSRPSRLVKSSFDYVRKSIPTIIRSYARYRPLSFFGWLSAIPGVIGAGARGPLVHPARHRRRQQPGPQPRRRRRVPAHRRPDPHLRVHRRHPGRPAQDHLRRARHAAPAGVCARSATTATPNRPSGEVGDHDRGP